MEYGNEYLFECIQNLRQLVCNIGGCKTIEELMSGQENTTDNIKSINSQGRDK